MSDSYHNRCCHNQHMESSAGQPPRQPRRLASTLSQRPFTQTSPTYQPAEPQAEQTGRSAHSLATVSNTVGQTSLTIAPVSISICRALLASPHAIHVGLSSNRRDCVIAATDVSDILSFLSSEMKCDSDREKIHLVLLECRC